VSLGIGSSVAATSRTPSERAEGPASRPAFASMAHAACRGPSGGGRSDRRRPWAGPQPSCAGPARLGRRCGGVSFARATEAADELQRVLALLAEAEAAATEIRERPGWPPWRSATGDRARAAAACRPGRCTAPAATRPPGASRPSAARGPAPAGRRFTSSDASDQAEQRLGPRFQARVNQRRHRTGAPSARSPRSAGSMTSSFAGSATHHHGTDLRARAERHRLGASQIPSATGPAGAGPPGPAPARVPAATLG
jgi:hypothetical protein